MIEVTIEEAKAQLSGLLQRVSMGEDVIICEGGKAIAKLVTTQQRPRRKLGEDAGKGWVADDFDAPLPDDIQAYFEGRGE
ncbi:MAG: type II toxin-antitoxin system prevent-host-death family antitoxin [Acidobacteriota bacterium]